MATLVSYKSRRTPAQNAIISFVVMVVAFVAFGTIPTQWFAAHYDYDINLGVPLVKVFGIAIYWPINWISWGWRLADIGDLKSSVHTMLMMGLIAAALALIFAIVVAQWLARYSDGMEGLHGTAHFAERKDVDKTGFINARGHKSSGVVIGSILLDSSGKVIHPNHKKFSQRYAPVYLTQDGSFLSRMRRKTEKRDGNGRPMFAVRKSVVDRVELLRDGGNTHLFAFCPTRSGKGVGMVQPTLLTWPNSVMVNDPKGEAYALSAGFRNAAGQDVIKFEPGGLEQTGARWNPLDEIRTFTWYDVADAQMIMSMACDPKGEGLNDYFDKAGYEFLTAVALHVRYIGKEGSLAGVANYLGDPQWDNDKQMYTEMMSAKHDPKMQMKWVDTLGKPTQTHPMIANAAKTMLNKEDKDRSGVLSTAKSLLSLFLDPIVAQNTCCSDFLVRDLMIGKKPVSLYYVVSPADMERLVPLTRLFYALFIRRNAADMEFKDGRSVANYTFPLLMIIDEASSLRKLPILQEALGYVAGYGIRMFMLVQDITQVEELYGDKQSFDSGAETRIAYAPNKIETAEKLARMTGKTTITEQNASSSRDIIGIKAGSVSLSTNKTARDLLTADELMALHDQDMIIFVKGQPPIYGRKAYYYENPTLIGRASIPPPEQSARLRVVTKVNPALKAPTVAQPKDQVETALERWSVRRDAMRREALESQITPDAATAAVVKTQRANMGKAEAGQGDDQQSATGSRYANKVVIVSEDERRSIQEMVANVALVSKLASIEAF